MSYSTVYYYVQRWFAAAVDLPIGAGEFSPQINQHKILAEIRFGGALGSLIKNQFFDRTISRVLQSLFSLPAGDDLFLKCTALRHRSVISSSSE